MTATDTMKVGPADPRTGTERRSVLGSWWVIGGFALILLLALGWRFLGDPSLSAPTRDPAWYTWRAQVILDADPASVVGEWGPGGLFSGGYRVTVPLAGALLQRVVGIDRYTFSAFLMLGMPLLAGLALGAGAVRSRRDPLAMLTTLLATVALFLTTPYVGYLDNITVLFLLCLTLPFIHAARESWGARTALFLIGIAAAFTHPTTCVIFGVVLLAVFGWHFLTSRFSFAAALKADAPMLFSVGFGMFAGLGCWVVGIWGRTASLKDAALPPPYTAEFFKDRLAEWVGSLQPFVIVPFVAAAVVSTIVLARRERRPAHTYDLSAIWWLLAFVGGLTFLSGKEIPYYRFMNASAAPQALVGLGSFAVIVWFFSREEKSSGLAAIGGAALAAWGVLALLWGDGDLTALGEIPRGVAAAVVAIGLLVLVRALAGNATRILTGSLATLLVVGSIGWVMWDGLQHRWVSDQNQWANQAVRTSLAAVRQVTDAAETGAERPIVLVMNYNDTADETGTNTAYGWAKTYTNVFRTGLSGANAKYQATYLGAAQNFLAGRPTTGSSEGYNDAAEKHFEEMETRFSTYPEDPVVLLIGQYYKGICNGGACAADDPSTPENESEVSQQQLFDQTVADAVKVGPDVYALEGAGLWTPPGDVVDRAEAAAAEEGAKFENHPGPLDNLPSNLLVVGLLALLLVVPGLLAARWFGLETTTDRIGLIPGMSVVLVLLSGIAVLAVWRGSLTTAKGWVVVAVAIGLGAALRVADGWLRRPLESFGNFFNRLFSVFSNRDFAVLVGVQYLVQAGQGVIQGAIGKSIAFGGEKGFDVSTVPSADYLLKVVLALYVPYTLFSPFIGVFIDRFARRRVVWWSNIITAIVVGIVALAVLLPLSSDTTEGKAGPTVALIVGLLAAQAVVRVALAVKSAAIPDVLSGRDLLQGNGLSQAGGALFQVIGIAFALGAGAALPAWFVVLLGAGVLVVAAIVAKQMRHIETRPHATSFAREASQVVRNIVAGLKEVAGRPAAALGLSSFQMLRYQFWGFGLFTFALYAKNLVEGGDASTVALGLSGGGGLAGGVLGLILAQKWKDRAPPIRLLLASMALLGAGTLVFGAFVSLAGFAAMLFVGFFSFFLGKISADTIMQQSMPDDFRGRAFALFDIAYNLGFIVPALILSFVWVEGDESRTRVILMASGAVFLALTLLVASWARRIRDQFAPQDDLVAVPEIAGDPV